jgi:hypothetical protein
LTDEETLLDLALNAVIEALRMNPDRYAVIYNTKYDSSDNVFNNNNITSIAAAVTYSSSSLVITCASYVPILVTGGSNQSILISLRCFHYFSCFRH